MGYEVNFIVSQPKYSDPAPQVIDNDCSLKYSCIDLIKIENLLKKFERLHWNILLSII